MGPEYWKQRPYKVRPLFLSPFMPKGGHPVPTKALSTESRCGHAVCTLRVHTPTSPCPPLSAHAEPISKGHCWKWQNQAESLMTPYGVIGKERVLNAIACMCLWYHFQQSPWEIGSVRAERTGQREVGWYTQKVKTAWLCSYGLGCENSSNQ